jgi:hypothetical protein
MPRSIEEIVVAPSPHIIPTSLYNLKGAKREGAINASGNLNSIDGKSQWYSFDFVKSVYLTCIEIEFEGYDSHNGFQFNIDHVDGTRHDQWIQVGENKVTLQTGKLSTGFQFKPDQKIWSRPKIISIKAIGMNIEEFHKFEWAIRDYERRLEELEKRETQQNNLALDISNMRIERAALESEIGKSRAESAELALAVTTAKNEQLIYERSIDHSQQELAQTRSKIAEVAKSLREKEREFDDQVYKLRMFPTEISGFVREGNRSTIWYAFLGAPFAIILCIIVYSLYSSAMDLSLLWKRDPEVDIWTIVLTRIPFMILAVALIETCGYLVGRLIFEVIRINRQRLDFAKLSIIAKDVTQVAGHTAGMDQKQIFDQSTSLKMDLLREHMKNYTGAEFEYKGTAIITALVSVASKLADKIPAR